jgi:hypothetical protein
MCDNASHRADRLRFASRWLPDAPSTDVAKAVATGSPERKNTEGGTRTHTPLRALDFESSASAIPPLRHGSEIVLMGNYEFTASVAVVNRFELRRRAVTVSVS